MTQIKPKVLWCVNIQGPDDVVAVPSYLDAVKAANRWNGWWEKYRIEKPLHEQFDARMWAVPLEWPWSAQAHAESVTNPSADYADFLRDEARHAD